MIFPNNLKYTRKHEWLRIEGVEAVIGITDFAQKELGDIVYIDINTEGETLSAGEKFGAIEAVKIAEELFMPVSGTIISVNSLLESAPDTINKDPYGEGWLIRVNLADPEEVNGLLTSSVYEESCTKE